jgi:hypothetical protein
MKKFKELVSLCKASVEITVNEHKNDYSTVENYISKENREGIEDDVFDEMVKRDTVVEIRAYSHTPVGFYHIFHYDIDKAVEEALDCVKN